MSTKFKDDIPKKILYVKLKTDISDERKRFITNGIKSFFKGQNISLYDVKEVIKSLERARLLFEALMTLIAIISFIFTYFFIKVNVGQNLLENLWEFAQLRAIGLTKSQSTRICLYEQYIVIVSSTILGLLGGVGLSILVTTVFYEITEFQMQLQMPKELTTAVVILGLLTTFMASYPPIRELNEVRIARALVG